MGAPEADPHGRTRLRRVKLALSEMLFIMTLFHLSPFRDFKHFWIYGIRQKYRRCFGELPSCSHFVALMPRLFMPFCVLVHGRRGQETGIHVAASGKPAVRHNIPISRSRVFEGLARRGRRQPAGFTASSCTWRSTTGARSWAVKITPGNTDDRAVLHRMTAEAAVTRRARLAGTRR